MTRGHTAFLAFGVFALSLARGGEWDREESKLATSCGNNPFTDLAGVGGCAAFLFNSGEPLHFMIPQSVVPGGGSALGLILTQPLDVRDWTGSNLTLDAGSSLRQFWFADATLTFSHRRFGGDWNTADDRFQVQAYAHAHGLPLMPFYGIGPDTDRANITDFGERDIRAGVNVFIPLKSWLAVGSQVEYLAPRINGINEPAVRSIGSYYTEATAPGLTAQPGFAHYEVFAQPRWEWTWTQIHSKLDYSFYQDTDTGHYSFRRFRADYLQKIYPERQKEATGGGTGVRTQPKYDSVLYIAGRFTASETAAGNVVPFYLQETIGGSDIDNTPTLRGFQDYRFRAPDLFSIQVQYERRIMPTPAAGANTSTLRKAAGALGILAFYDAGDVASSVGDLSLSDVRQSFGFGLTFWSGNKVWLRAYIGLGSGEGSHTFFGVTDPSAQLLHL
jgi:hypothetical protein